LKNSFFWFAVVQGQEPDVFLDRRLDPPHRVGRQPEALVGLEALDRLHQPDIAFGDDFRDRQAVAAIAHGDLGHEPQMAGDEPMRGVTIFVLAPALRQHEFFLRFQHREPPDLFEVPGQAGFTRQYRQGSSVGHDSALSLIHAPANRRAVVPSLPEPTAQFPLSRTCNIHGPTRRAVVTSHQIGATPR
jgi:hypothetical protein